MLTKSAGARAHYDRRRAAGDHHNAALRNLANKLLGRLWWCLANNKPWDDDAAWPHPTEPAASGRCLTPDPRGMSTCRTWSGFVYVAFVVDVFAGLIPAGSVR